jgi:Fe2+ or Zn2+ uptake regulation protein
LTTDNPRSGFAEDLMELHRHVADRLARPDQRYTEHRYTGGRRLLVEALALAGRPLTLPDILATTPDLAQSSAYRNLDVLERSGVIRRITVGGERSHFELAEPLIGHHHHMVCVDCGRVEDMHLAAEVESIIDRHLESAARAVGFTPVDHRVDLDGRCADCVDPVDDR